MKKIWKYAILLVTLSALLCMSAFAGDGLEVNNFVTDAVAAVEGKEYFTATYTGEKGAQYLILMLAAEDVPESQPAGAAMPDPTKTKILYVNQAQAGEDGVVSFETVYPMALEDSVIWLTGGDDPVALASIDVPEPVGVTVSGTAASWNSTDDAVYLLYADTVDDATIKAEWNDGSYATSANVIATAEGGVIAEITVDDKAMQSQSFSFETIADGIYKLAICKPGKYIPRIVEVTVDGENVDLGQQKLWLYGDVNYDGRIRTGDATQVLQYIAKKRTFTAEEFAAADVTGDGNIRTGDATQIKRYIAKKSSDFDDMK